ncbi:MAG: hypothetical protein HYZ47_04815 [Simkania negevensis]|nr:hypothetical protein [Simkania negevensis]
MKKMQIKKWFFFFIALFLPLISWAVAPSVSTLFLLYDAGETKGLLPVIHRYKEEELDFQVIALGTARHLIEEEMLPKENVIDLEKELQLEERIDRNWDRYHPLSQKTMNKIKEYVMPRVLVMGVASEIQAQFATTYQGSAKIVAFYDNVNLISRSIYEPLIRKIESVSDFFLVPSREAAASSFHKSPYIVGQPALDECVRSLSQQKGEIKEKMRSTLGLSSDLPIIAYIGGYDSDYGEAFQLFCQSILPMKGCQVLLSPHPKTEGKLEKEILAREKGEKRILFLKKPYSSLDAAALADLIVCHRSSLGVQLAFAGKKVIFLDLPQSKVPNPAVEEWKVAYMALSKEEFQRLLLDKESRECSSEEAYKKAGIPMESSEIIFSILRNL